MDILIKLLYTYIYIENLIDFSYLGNRSSAEPKNKGKMQLQTLKYEYVHSFLVLKKKITN